MSKTFYIISNYNLNPNKIIELISNEFIICHQGDENIVQDQIRSSSYFTKTKHTGHNISDYLNFIIENYKDLPERLGFIKGNIIGRHIKEEVFVERIKRGGFVSLYSDENTFKPIYSKAHRLLNQFIAQQIAPGVFLEKTNNWYIKSRRKGKFFPKLEDMYSFITGRELTKYITFIPGACMLVPRENILIHELDFYKKLLESVTYDFFPVEAYHLERCMLYIFCYPKK
jgi:hypothetical protein